MILAAYRRAMSHLSLCAREESANLWIRTIKEGVQLSRISPSHSLAPHRQRVLHVQVSCPQKPLDRPVIIPHRNRQLRALLCPLLDLLLGNPPKLHHSSLDDFELFRRRDQHTGNTWGRNFISFMSLKMIEMHGLLSLCVILCCVRIVITFSLRVRCATQSAASCSESANKCMEPDAKVKVITLRVLETDWYSTGCGAESFRSSL